jgi:hypothetical protein
MFRNGGYVRQMQMGGDPMMAPPMGGDPMMAPPMAGPAPQGMPPAPSVAGMPVPADASMDQAAAGAMQQGIDPAMLESMLQQAAGQFGNLDAAAETGDYEQVMNVIRGDQASLQDRRQELAGIVGDADAAQTPDSVLTLVQPIMQLAAVDQGIGGLAPETMNTPVTGDMAGGIMSTVNMGAEEQPMPGQGGPAPVNFNRGGPVGGRQGKLFREQQALYQSILNPAEEQAALDEQRKMTQAQMLFDIAQGGLMFASGAAKPGGSPAEQLAASFVQPLGNIGARAGEFQKVKDAQRAQKRQLDLAALQSAQQMYEGELTRSAASANVAPGETYELRDAEGNVLYTGPVSTRSEQTALRQQFPNAVIFRKVTAPAAANLRTFVDRNDPKKMVRFDLGTEDGRRQANALGTDYVMIDTPSLSDIRDDPEDRSANITLFVDRNDPKKMVRFDLGTEDGRRQANALGENWLPTTTPSLDDIAGGAESPLGSSFNAGLLMMVSDADTMLAYANGTLDQTDPSKAALITNTLTLATQARPVWDQTLGREVLMPATRLSDQVLAMIQQRGESGLPVPTLGSDVGGPQVGASVSSNPTEKTQGRVRFNEDGTIDFSSFESDPTFIITGVDLTQSQDWTSGVNRFFNQIAGQLQPVLGGSGYLGEKGRITSEADTQLNYLANQVMRVVRSGTDGRIFALDANLLENEVSKFRPGTFKTDNGARDALVTTRNALASSWNDAQLVRMNPGDYDRQTVVGARTLQAQVERLLAETTAAVAVYDRFISSSPLGDAAADRAATAPTAPRTSGLPRASGGD